MHMLYLNMFFLIRIVIVKAVKASNFYGTFQNLFFYSIPSLALIPSARIAEKLSLAFLPSLFR